MDINWVVDTTAAIFISLFVELIVLFFAFRAKDNPKKMLWYLLGGTLLVGALFLTLFLESERIKSANQPAPTHTPTPPTLNHALMTPSGGIAAVALEYQAEDAGKFADEPFRKNASGGKTVHLVAGERIKFPVSVVESGYYILYIRHSNDNLNPPKKTEILEVMLNGEKLGQYLTEDTGDSSKGWDIFKEPAFGDVLLDPGTNEIELAVTGGDGYGIEIDAIILVPR